MLTPITAEMREASDCRRFRMENKLARRKAEFLLQSEMLMKNPLVKHSPSFDRLIALIDKAACMGDNL